MDSPDVITPAWDEIHAINPRLSSAQIWNLLLGANQRGTLTRYGITVTRRPAGYDVEWR